MKKSLAEKFVNKDSCHCGGKGGSSSAVYGLGLIGSLIFFFQHSVSASDYFMSILKAIVWPAILAYKAFQLLGL